MPKKLKDVKLKKKGESFTMHAENSDLMATKIKDRKVFTILSTAHSTASVPTGKTNRNQVPVRKPECVHWYNRYMNAVDRSDQMVI